MMGRKYLVIFMSVIILLTVFSCQKKEEEIQIQSKQKVTYEPKLVVEGYKGFNVISYGDKYYGLDQNEGAFYISKVEKKEYKRCFIGNSVEEVKQLIDKSIK